MKTIEDADVVEAFKERLQSELDETIRLIDESREYRAPVELRERYGTNLVQVAVDALLTAEPGDRVVVLVGDAKLEPLFVALREYDIKVMSTSTPCRQPGA